MASRKFQVSDTHQHSRTYLNQFCCQPEHHNYFQGIDCLLRKATMRRPLHQSLARQYVFSRYDICHIRSTNAASRAVHHDLDDLAGQSLVRSIRWKHLLVDGGRARIANIPVFDRVSTSILGVVSYCLNAQT